MARRISVRIFLPDPQTAAGLVLRRARRLTDAHELRGRASLAGTGLMAVA